MNRGHGQPPWLNGEYGLRGVRAGRCGGHTMVVLQMIGEVVFLLLLELILEFLHVFYI